MRQNNALQVYYDERLVGTLAMTADHKAAFQYDDEWLENGFSISPFSLPLKKAGICSPERLFRWAFWGFCR